jgi:hypothetical protein
VQLSSKPLEVECTKETYKPVRGQIKCLSPRQREQKDEEPSIVMLALLVPLAVAAPPFALPQVAAQAVPHAAGVVVGRATLGNNADVCTYLGVAPYMTRDSER